MAQGLERLNVILSLVDRVSRPLRAVQGRLAVLNDQVERSTRHVTTGFLAGSGAVLGLVGALKPAIDHAAALREVASLGVETDNLALLSQAGMDYAARFGESATAFVRSAYDIQSAIAGLTGDELSRFTTAANITAKATKASAEEVTGFFGTMFGIFQRQADAMGRGAWVEALAGQTARAVQMFKTTGPELSRAFTQLGADATSMGLSMAEQFAVLGRLQATMGGSEAATKFRAFLRGVGKAQGELGLSFSDAQGHMLALPEILKRIRGKFGQIDTVAKSDLMKKAFGSDEAVALVKLLLADTEGLRSNITAIESAGGLEAASQMADTMVDPFQRLQRIIENVAITWGSFLLPLITPYVEKLADAGKAVRAWAERFPHLTRLLGLAAVGVFGFMLAVAALKIAVGLLGFALLPLRVGLMLLRAAVPVAVWVASTVAMLAWRGALLAVQGVLALARIAVIAFNVALWLNPITWIVAAIVALIAAIVLSVVYWGELKAAAGAAAAWVVERWTAGVAWIAERWQSLVTAGGQAWAGLQALAGAASDSVAGAWNAALDWLGGRWTALASVASGAWAVVEGAGASAWNRLSAAWSAGLTWLQGGWAALVASAAGAWEDIRAAASASWERIAGLVQQGLAAQGAAWNAVAAPAETALGQLRERFAVFGDWLLGALERAATAAGAFFAGLPGQIAAGVTGALEGLLDTIGHLAGPETLLGKALGALGIDIGVPQAEVAGGARLAQAPRAATIGGEARQAIRNVANATDNSRRLNIGTVNVTSSQRLEGHELIRQLQLAADG